MACGEAAGLGQRRLPPRLCRLAGGRDGLIEDEALIGIAQESGAGAAAASPGTSGPGSGPGRAPVAVHLLCPRAILSAAALRRTRLG